MVEESICQAVSVNYSAKQASILRTQAVKLTMTPKRTKATQGMVQESFTELQDKGT